MPQAMACCVVHVLSSDNFMAINTNGVHDRHGAMPEGEPDLEGHVLPLADLCLLPFTYLSNQNEHMCM